MIANWIGAAGFIGFILIGRYCEMKGEVWTKMIDVMKTASPASVERVSVEGVVEDLGVAAWPQVKEQAIFNALLKKKEWTDTSLMCYVASLAVGLLIFFASS